MQQENITNPLVDAMFPDEMQAFEDPAEQNICDSCQ